MIKVDIAIIGGGPAGLCAAIEAGKTGASVLLIERSDLLGGQLIKQTHMFFGSKKQYASTRGIDIAQILIGQVKEMSNITVWTEACALGMYEDDVITVEHRSEYKKIRPNSIIVATGANEKFLPFENNDLPGIYGAGAVQTLMNLYGVIPAKEVVMIGAGNIGLIVSYQLMQAGVKVNAIVDAAPSIGGYLVHAAKIRRMGVPIYTSTTVEKANGTTGISSVTLVKVDSSFNKIKGTEFVVNCDNLCISVGLSPLAELLWQVGCEMKYVGSLGGFVPTRSRNLETSVENVFIAGDVAGVEEASSAMVEGRIAGLCAAHKLGMSLPDFNEKLADFHAQSDSLRSGAVGAKIREGIAQVETN